MKIGLIPCCGKANRIFNIPKFILPLKNANYSLLSFWCKLMIEKNCEKIIIGSSLINKPFIEYIIDTQLKDIETNIFIKVIENSSTMNETILEMIKDEEYDLAIMGMPDTNIDYISNDLIDKIINNDEYIIGSYLWNIRNSQKEKIGLCNIDDNYIIDIIDKNKDCSYNYGWGVIIFKKEFSKFINKNEEHLGYSMKLAINNSIKIPYKIIRGLYWDCGTITEYKEYLNSISISQPIYIKGTIIIVAVYVENDDIKVKKVLNAITHIRNIYKNEIIILVDNQSLNNSWYELAISLNMYLIKNTSKLYKYEIGAYNLALKYFRADKYICIQSSIYFNKKIEEKLDEFNKDAYAFKIHNKLDWDENGLNIINKYLSFCDMEIRKNEKLVLWNSFYCNNLFMEELINSGLLDLRCNNKDKSFAYERILGVYFERTLGNIKDINCDTYHKFFLNQW